MIDGHIIATAVCAVLSLFLAIISWFLRERAREIESRLGALEQRIHAEEIDSAKTMVEIRQVTEAISLIGEMRAEIALRYITREDMATLMGRIDETREQLSGLRQQLARYQGRIDRQEGTPA